MKKSVLRIIGLVLVMVLAMGTIVSAGFMDDGSGNLKVTGNIKLDTPPADVRRSIDLGNNCHIKTGLDSSTQYDGFQLWAIGNSMEINSDKYTLALNFSSTQGISLAYGGGQVAVGHPRPSAQSTSSNFEKFTVHGRTGLYGKTWIQGPLEVHNTVYAKEVVVSSDTSTWPDYVFADSYNLRTLSQVEQYIKEHKHLPNIPSAQEIKENGISVGEMQNKLMEKVEELTLYMIDLKKENDEVKKQNDELKARIEKLEAK